MKSSKLLKLIIFALLGTISVVLMFLNFPLPFLPSYLKIDFSDVPALLAGLLFTPVAGIIVEGVKNSLYLVLTGAHDPVGVVGNFFAGTLFVLPVAVLYHRLKGPKSLVSGLITGTIVMALGMGVLNYFVLLPAYSLFMGMEEMAIPTVKWATVIAGITPFNLIKGTIVGLLFIPLFAKLRPWLERKRASLV
ncbi:ECF transporter S component [Aquibacillus rhizosphaerae]|uniref:Riboflavin transporter n=1 Tax=Aquibacillus rhizosphaerae TaxID=3051431 RepID=A0ABT7L9L9_9BACI|nr:ECF transporter S component [Aquibacillus sp. LR5S19]MDL4842553.1 ECF transporter S component [Aquibacillus sp. LR5S19]